MIYNDRLGSPVGHLLYPNTTLGNRYSSCKKQKILRSFFRKLSVELSLSDTKMPLFKLKSKYFGNKVGCCY